MTVPERDRTPAEAYQEYFAPALFGPLARLLTERAAPRPGERVLDVASGTGIVAREAAPLVGPDGRVVGVDLNPAMIEVARAQPVPGSATIEWRHGDGTALPFEDATFDLVLCQQGLQFFPDRQAGVREMRRVLAGGGRAAVAVWHGLDEHPLFAALTEAELPHLKALGASVTRADLEAPFSLGAADELRALLAGAGFAEVDVTSSSFDARFATADRFVERMEFAYAAVIPAFAEDPEAFATYLDAVTRDTRPTIERYRDGDEIVVPMHANIAVARV